MSECYEYVKKLIEKQQCTPIVSSRCTTVEFRESLGKDNCKIKSFKVYNFTSSDIEKIIINDLK